MPGDPPTADADGPGPRLSAWQRVLLALPRLSPRAEGRPFGQRLRDAALKPAEPPTAKAEPAPSVADLEAAVRYADDKERVIGLVLAPLAAAIGILVVGALISADPAATLRNGKPNPHHVSISLYHEVTVVVIVLSVMILVTALLRRRLFLGLALALFGLSMVSLGYWGFGVPFVFAAAWYLVRAYRLQRDLREATGSAPGRPSPRRAGPAATGPGRGSNKRYTPPTAPKRSVPPKTKKPPDKRKAG